MSTVNPHGLWRKNQPSEIEEVWHVERQSASGHQPDEIGKQASALVHRILLTSTREIDRLIGGLTDLRKDLERRSRHIQNDIVEYAELSQSAGQLTKIVSDSMYQVAKGSGTPTSEVAELAVPHTPEDTHGGMPTLPGA